MAVVRRKGDVLLVASAQFLDGLDDRALRAVTAPEVSHLRHGRADLYGAGLSGDPQALSSALVAASRFADEARRRFFGVGAWRWLLWPLSWRMPSHPSLQKRLAALADLGATLPD